MAGKNYSVCLCSWCSREYDFVRVGQAVQMIRSCRMENSSPSFRRRKPLLPPPRVGESVFLSLLLRNDPSFVSLGLLLRHPIKRVTTPSCYFLVCSQYFISPTFPASNQVPETTSTLPPTKFLAPRRHT